METRRNNEKKPTQDSHEHYTYSVSWSEEDKEFVGTCEVFPSLSFLGKSQQDVLRGIVQLAGETLEEMKSEENSQ